MKKALKKLHLGRETLLSLEKGQVVGGGFAAKAGTTPEETCECSGSCNGSCNA